MGSTSSSSGLATAMPVGDGKASNASNSVAGDAVDGKSKKKQHDNGITSLFLEGDRDFEFDQLGRSFRRCSLVSLTVWAILIFLVFNYSPADSFEKPNQRERTAHFLSFILLFVTNGSRIFPLYLQGNSFAFIRSGVLQATMTVQMIASISNLIMSTIPCPVMTDHVSGMRIHLVRWVEWIPVSFLMAFLTCNVDAPTRRNGHVNWSFATAIALSTAAGVVFPFCQDALQWNINMAVSWLLFFTLYVLTYRRASVFRRLSRLQKDATWTVVEREDYDLAKTSYGLCMAASVTWTFLALGFTVLAMAPKFCNLDDPDVEETFALAVEETCPVPVEEALVEEMCISVAVAEISLPVTVQEMSDPVANEEMNDPVADWLSNPAAPVFLTCFVEVFSKIWYLGALVGAYVKVFDESARAVRRLEELRNFMSAVWASSSDVIVFCVRRKNGGQVSARVSPAFLRMIGYSKTPPSHELLGLGNLSLVIEIVPDDGCCYVVPMDLSKSVTRHDVSQLKGGIKTRRIDLDGTESLSADDENLLLLAKLAMRASQAQKTGQEFSIVQTFVKVDGEEEIEMPCEAKTAGLEGNSCVLVLRDISDRLDRFEAEKVSAFCDFRYDAVSIGLDHHPPLTVPAYPATDSRENLSKERCGGEQIHSS